MANFTLDAVTLPTPQPYDSKDPQRQIENVCFVLLQVLSLAKTAGFVFTDTVAAGTGDISALTQAVNDLKYNGEVLDLGPIKIFRNGKSISVIT